MNPLRNSQITSNSTFCFPKPKIIIHSLNNGKRCTSVACSKSQDPNMVEAYEIAVKVSEFFSNVYNHCGMDNLGKIDGSSGLVGLF